MSARAGRGIPRRIASTTTARRMMRHRTRTASGLPTGGGTVDTMVDGGTGDELRGDGPRQLGLFEHRPVTTVGQVVNLATEAVGRRRRQERIEVAPDHLLRHLCG